MQFKVNISGKPFNIDYTLSSGQVFRWEKREDYWQGVVGDTLLMVRQEQDSLSCIASSDSINAASIVRYFRLNDDLSSILASISKDSAMMNAVKRFYGTRLILQDPWECLISFILSENANIPRIKKMVRKLCESFGEQREFEQLKYYSFPSPSSLSEASIERLKECGLGYRSKYVKETARIIERRELILEELESMSYSDAFKKLVGTLPGVGPKVADCLLLYGFGKDESFPIDRWIIKALKSYYPEFVSSKSYRKISSSLRNYFGSYSGYAQLYLFMLARS